MLGSTCRQEDAVRRRANQLSGFDILLSQSGEGAGAHDTDHAHREENSHAQRHGLPAAPNDLRQQEQQYQPREGEQHVDDPLQEQVDRALRVGRDHAQKPGQRQRQSPWRPGPATSKAWHRRSPVPDNPVRADQCRTQCSPLGPTRISAEMDSASPAMSGPTAARKITIRTIRNPNAPSGCWAQEPARADAQWGFLGNPVYVKDNRARLCGAHWNRILGSNMP